jgi:uncharacterized integral membrane protein
MTLWIVLGVLIGIGFYWLVTRTSFKLKWYEWVLAILSMILILFAIQNYGASRTELEPAAAGYLLLIFGLPGVILGVIPAVLAWRRTRAPEA